MINNITLIKVHSDIITYLNYLKDGRLVSCSNDMTLKIYKQNTFEIQFIIKEHKYYVNSFTELNNNKIITCSFDTTIKIIDLIDDKNYKIVQTLYGHLSNVLKIIEINEKTLISISWDKSMKIWKLNMNNNYFCFQTINIQNTISNCNIIKLNNKEFCTVTYDENCLKFWTIERYSNTNTLYNIDVSWNINSMCLLNDDLLCVAGNNYNGFYIIKISTHNILKKITGPKKIITLFKCVQNFILCVIEDKNENINICKYKFNDLNLEKVKEKEKAHNKMIYSCVEYKDEIIVSGGEDLIIKLWK